LEYILRYQGKYEEVILCFKLHNLNSTPSASLYLQGTQARLGTVCCFSLLSQFLHAFLPTCFVISYALPLRSHHVFLVGLLTKELVLIWIDSLSNPKGVGDEHALWKHFFFFLKKINVHKISLSIG
jgi:hypothetical protein